VRCNTIDGFFDPSQAKVGFGGNTGLESNGCPSGYFGVGKQCIYFPNSAIPPTSGPSIYSDSILACSSHNNDILYSPIDVVQNTVIKSVLQIWVKIKPLGRLNNMIL